MPYLKYLPAPAVALSLFATLILATPAPVAGAVEGGSHPNEFRQIVRPDGEELVLFLASPTPPGRSNSELWRTDGTTAGTISLEICSDCRVKTFLGGRNGTFVDVQLSGVGPALAWSDGTVAGTRLMEGGPPAPLEPHFIGTRHHYSPALNRLLFLAEDGDGRVEIWAWDGSEAPPTRLFTSSGFTYRDDVSYADTTDRAFFALTTVTKPRQVEVFATDGTAAGTLSLGSAPTGSRWTPLRAAGDGAAYVTTDGDCQAEIWAAGPQRPLDRIATVGGKVCELRTEAYWSIDGKAFFLVQPEGQGSEIWATGGTPESTAPVSRLGPDQTILESLVEEFDSQLFFFSRSPYSLWRSDGTPGGTERITLPPSVWPLGVGAQGDLLAWQAQERDGYRLWTVAAGSTTAQAGGYLPERGPVTLIRAGERWYAYSSPVGLPDTPQAELRRDALWVLDPDSPRFHHAATIPSFSEEQVRFLDHALAGDLLIFATDDGFHGTEPWVSDGTAEGTRMLLDLNPIGTALAPPRAPVLTGLVERGDRNEVELTWEPGDGEATVGYFEVQVRHPHMDWTTHENLVDAARTQVRIPISRGTPYHFRVREVNGVGASPWSGERFIFLSSVLGEDDAPSSCLPRHSVRCFADGRFGVQVHWRNQRAIGGADRAGRADVARAEDFEGLDGCFPDPLDGGHEEPCVEEEGRTGFFWFFAPDNVELVVKMLDGGSLNRHAWLFYGALTDVEYWVTVEDYENGEARTWHNPPGEICGLADTTAFPSPPGGASGALRLDASPVKSPPPPQGAVSTAPCVPDARTLCLLEGRFAVTVEWTSPLHGTSGAGGAVPFADRSGFFWFFRPDNIELVVKILDGTQANGKTWVFYGALTDVGYTLTVTDTANGNAVERYVNEPGNVCGGADTDAF